MAKRTKTWSKFLPPRDLIRRRNITLIRLLRKEANERISKRKRSKDDELTPTEMLEWAVLVERIQ